MFYKTKNKLSSNRHIQQVGKKKIYFVNPASGSNIAGLTECIDILGYDYLCANLSLPTLAAMVDESKYSIEICDENVDTIDFDTSCDIVALTIYHFQRHRTYEIAREFKKRGCLVIVGGPYATQNMTEGHELFDVVFCGETEITWLQFLNDYLEGNYKSLYIENNHPDITGLPVPRFDLMHNDRYLLGAIQVSRGCPHKCDFCTCTVLYGQKMRYKTNNQIINELNQLHKLGYRSIFILDDNLIGDQKRSREVIIAIRDWNRALKEPVMFSTSASIDIASQSDLGPIFSDAMITNVFVGIETPNLDSLKDSGKYQNLKSDVIEDVKIMHRLGVDVSAGIMVGFDNDDTTIFEKQLSFIQELSIPICFAGMILAPDGTELKERLIKEGRYIKSEEIKDHTISTNVKPKKMTSEELHDGYYWLMKQLYNEKNFIERVSGALSRYPNPSQLTKRYKPRETRNPLKLISIIYQLVAYYLIRNKKLSLMFFKYIIMILKNYKYASLAIYWLIAFKHFQELIRIQDELKSETMAVQKPSENVRC